MPQLTQEQQQVVDSTAKLLAVDQPVALPAAKDDNSRLFRAYPVVTPAY